MIITGRTIEQLDAQFNDSTSGGSGVISETLQSYRDVPAINGMTEIVIKIKWE